MISDVLVLNTFKNLNLFTLQALCQASQIAHTVSMAITTNSQLKHPALIWTPRDVNRKPEINGKACSDAEIFEHFLKPKPGLTLEIISTNIFLENIRTFFEDRGCIAIPEIQPRSPFAENLQKLKNTVHDKLKTSKIRTLSETLGVLIEFLNSERRNESIAISVPAAVETDNLNSIDEIITTMRQKILNLKSTLPLSSKRLNNHMKKIKSETDQTLRAKLNDQIASKLEEKIENAFLDLSSELLEANEKASNAKCLRLLRSYFAEIESNLTSGKYSCKGSPDLLEADFEVVKKKYFSESKKDHFGPEVSRTLKNFQQNTVSEFKFLGTVCLAICRVQHNLFRGSITVPLACCLTGLDSAALLKFNQIQIYLLGQIQTGGRMYSDASPPLFHPFNCT